jgi:hypothetical protein
MLSAVLIGALTRSALAGPVPASPTPASPAPASTELSNAADATGNLATGPAATAGEGSSDDIDLAALGLDPTANAFDDKLNVYGFADANYAVLHFDHPSPVVAQDSHQFSLAHVNLYLAKNLTAKVRALIEVGFTFLPNGSRNADGTSVSTTAADLTNYSRTAQWAGIVIDRAYAEYDLLELASLPVFNIISRYELSSR